MTALLIVLSASGWTAAVWLLATRRATTRTEPAPILRPDFGLFADDADRAGMPSSAAMYRSMSDAWPHDEPASPVLVREDPGENRAGVPSIDREDVERLHGVYCYRDLNKRFDEPRYSRYTSYEPGNEHPLSECCICHHAVWHSCPDIKAGERIFNALPSRGVRTAA